MSVRNATNSAEVWRAAVLPSTSPVLVLKAAYSDSVQSALATALGALHENDTELAREVVRSKPRLTEQLGAYRTLHHERRQDSMEEAALAKAYDLPVVLHSCGSSSWAYDDFIEMGIDVVDTLQPEAKDMAPAYLKKTFGDRLAFHGCISTAGPVAKGSVQETVENVRQTLEVMMPGGGYCFAPTHAIQDNSPTGYACC